MAATIGLTPGKLAMTTSQPVAPLTAMPRTLDYDALLRLFTHRHTSSLLKRQAAALRALAREKKDGVQMEEIEPICRIMHLAMDKLPELAASADTPHGLPLSVFIQPLCSLIALFGIPFKKQKAYEEIENSASLSRILSTLVRALSLDSPQLIHAICQSMHAFMTPNNAATSATSTTASTTNKDNTSHPESRLSPKKKRPSPKQHHQQSLEHILRTKIVASSDLIPALVSTLKRHASSLPTALELVALCRHLASFRLIAKRFDREIFGTLIELIDVDLMESERNKQKLVVEVVQLVAILIEHPTNRGQKAGNGNGSGSNTLFRTGRGGLKKEITSTTNLGAEMVHEALINQTIFGRTIDQEMSATTTSLGQGTTTDATPPSPSLPSSIVRIRAFATAHGCEVLARLVREITLKGYRSNDKVLRNDFLLLLVLIARDEESRKVLATTSFVSGGSSLPGPSSLLEFLVAQCCHVEVALLNQGVSGALDEVLRAPIPQGAAAKVGAAGVGTIGGRTANFAAPTVGLQKIRSLRGSQGELDTNFNSSAAPTDPFQHTRHFESCAEDMFFKHAAWLLVQLLVSEQCDVSSAGKGVVVRGVGMLSRDVVSRYPGGIASELLHSCMLYLRTAFSFNVRAVQRSLQQFTASSDRSRIESMDLRGIPGVDTSTPDPGPEVLAALALVDRLTFSQLLFLQGVVLGSLQAFAESMPTTLVEVGAIQYLLEFIVEIVRNPGLSSEKTLHGINLVELQALAVKVLLEVVRSNAQRKEVFPPPLATQQFTRTSANTKNMPSDSSDSRSPNSIASNDASTSASPALRQLLSTQDDDAFDTITAAMAYASTKPSEDVRREKTPLRPGQPPPRPAEEEAAEILRKMVGDGNGNGNATSGLASPLSPSASGAFTASSPRSSFCSSLAALDYDYLFSVMLALVAEHAKPLSLRADAAAVLGALLDAAAASEEESIAGSNVNTNGSSNSSMSMSMRGVLQSTMRRCKGMEIVMQVLDDDAPMRMATSNTASAASLGATDETNMGGGRSKKLTSNLLRKTGTTNVSATLPSVSPALSLPASVVAPLSLLRSHSSKCPSFLPSLIDLLRGSIESSHQNRAIFLALQGVDCLLDLIAYVAPKEQRRMIVAFLSDLLSTPSSSSPSSSNEGSSVVDSEVVRAKNFILEWRTKHPTGEDLLPDLRQRVRIQSVVSATTTTTVTKSNKHLAEDEGVSAIQLLLTLWPDPLLEHFLGNSSADSTNTAAGAGGTRGDDGGYSSSSDGEVGSDRPAVIDEENHWMAKTSTDFGEFVTHESHGDLDDAEVESRPSSTTSSHGSIPLTSSLSESEKALKPSLYAIFAALGFFVEDASSIPQAVQSFLDAHSTPFHRALLLSIDAFPKLNELETIEQVSLKINEKVRESIRQAIDETRKKNGGHVDVDPSHPDSIVPSLVLTAADSAFLDQNHRDLLDLRSELHQSYTNYFHELQSLQSSVVEEYLTHVQDRKSCAEALLVLASRRAKKATQRRHMMFKEMRQMMLRTSQQTASTTILVPQPHTNQQHQQVEPSQPTQQLRAKEHEEEKEHPSQPQSHVGDAADTDDEPPSEDESWMQQQQQEEEGSMNEEDEMEQRLLSDLDQGHTGAVFRVLNDGDAASSDDDSSESNGANGTTTASTAASAKIGQFQPQPGDYDYQYEDEAPLDESALYNSERSNEDGME